MNYFCITACIVALKTDCYSLIIFFIYLVSVGWIHPDALELNSLEATDNVTLGKGVQKIVIGNFVLNTLYLMECDRRWEE